LNANLLAVIGSEKLNLSRESHNIALINPFALNGHQIPLCLLFSFPIIQSQRQTMMNKVGIDLCTDVSIFSQAECARILEGFKVKFPANERLTKNILLKNLIDI
jgi:hypothetical protein